MTAPQYPCMFVTRTPVMRQAEAENKAFFKEAISVDLDLPPGGGVSKRWLSRLLDEAPETHARNGESTALISAISLCLSLVPLAVVEGLSGFHKGNS